MQIETIRKADIEKVALLVLQKKKQLEIARDMDTTERLYLVPKRIHTIYSASELL